MEEVDMIVTSVWQAFKKGKELKQAGVLKDIQRVTSVVTAILAATLALLRVFGVDIPLTDDQIVIAAGGIAALLFTGDAVVTTISSSKVGIPFTKPAEKLGQGD